MYNYFSNNNCIVPKNWIINHSLVSIYSLSSLLYCFNGFIIIYLHYCIPKYFELIEAFIWIWQGIISYMSDGYYLGKVSIFHQIDRYSSIIVTYLLLRKYLTISGILCCYEKYNLICYNNILICNNNSLKQLLKCELIIGLSYSFICFYKSINSINKCNKELFFKYHTLWHTGFPLTSLGFHIILLFHILLF